MTKPRLDAAISRLYDAATLGKPPRMSDIDMIIGVIRAADSMITFCKMSVPVQRYVKLRGHKLEVSKIGKYRHYSVVTGGT